MRRSGKMAMVGVIGLLAACAPRGDGQLELQAGFSSAATAIVEAGQLGSSQKIAKLKKWKQTLTAPSARLAEGAQTEVAGTEGIIGAMAAISLGLTPPAQPALAKVTMTYPGGKAVGQYQKDIGAAVVCEVLPAGTGRAKTSLKGGGGKNTPAGYIVGFAVARVNLTLLGVTPDQFRTQCADLGGLLVRQMVQTGAGAFLSY